MSRAAGASPEHRIKARIGSDGWASPSHTLHPKQTLHSRLKSQFSIASLSAFEICSF